MIDLLIKETGNGGDAVLRGNSLVTVLGLENMPFLAMFSGDGDWWGNNLLHPNEPDKQFKSETEKVLNEVALNSAGRVRIQQAILADLAFLKKAVPGTTIKADVTIPSDDRVEMHIQIDGKDFYLAWNPDEGFLTYQIT